jgi:hypothetical protein
MGLVDEVHKIHAVVSLLECLDVEVQGAVLRERHSQVSNLEVL